MTYVREVATVRRTNDKSGYQTVRWINELNKEKVLPFFAWARSKGTEDPSLTDGANPRTYAITALVEPFLKSNLRNAWVQLILLAQDDLVGVELSVAFERWTLDPDGGVVPHEVAFIVGMVDIIAFVAKLGSIG